LRRRGERNGGKESREYSMQVHVERVPRERGIVRTGAFRIVEP
jgi:hypothetical protein